MPNSFPLCSLIISPPLPPRYPNLHLTLLGSSTSASQSPLTPQVLIFSIPSACDLKGPRATRSRGQHENTPKLSREGGLKGCCGVGEARSPRVIFTFICQEFSCERPGRFYYFPIVYSSSFRVHASPSCALNAELHSKARQGGPRGCEGACG